MDISPVISAEAASDLKGDVSKIGASLCFFVPISLLISSAIVSIFSAVTSLEGEKLLLQMQSGEFYVIYTLLSAILPLLFCTLLLSKLFRQRASLLSLRPSVDANAFLYYVATGILSIPVSAIIANLTHNVLESFNVKTGGLSAPQGAIETVCFFAVFAVLIPILEELLFRFLILERLRRYGDAAAIIISAMFFSLAHSAFQSFGHTFVMGLVLGFVAVKTKSALASIIIHFVNNSFSLWSLVISSSQNVEKDLTILSFVIVTVIIAALFTVLSFRGKRDTFRFEFKGKEIKAGRKASVIFMNFWVLLFIIISISYAFISISL